MFSFVFFSHSEGLLDRSSLVARFPAPTFVNLFHPTATCFSCGERERERDVELMSFIVRSHACRDAIRQTLAPFLSWLMEFCVPALQWKVNGADSAEIVDIVADVLDSSRPYVGSLSLSFSLSLSVRLSVSFYNNLFICLCLSLWKISCFLFASVSYSFSSPFVLSACFCPFFFLVFSLFYRAVCCWLPSVCVRLYANDEFDLSDAENEPVSPLSSLAPLLLFPLVSSSLSLSLFPSSPAPLLSFPLVSYPVITLLSKVYVCAVCADGLCWCCLWYLAVVLSSPLPGDVSDLSYRPPFPLRWDVEWRIYLYIINMSILLLLLLFFFFFVWVLRPTSRHKTKAQLHVVLFCCHFPPPILSFFLPFIFLFILLCVCTFSEWSIPIASSEK